MAFQARKVSGAFEKRPPGARGKRHSESFSKYVLHLFIFLCGDYILKYVPAWREIFIQFCDELSKNFVSGRPYS